MGIYCYLQSYMNADVDADPLSYNDHELKHNVRKTKGVLISYSGLTRTVDLRTAPKL